MVHLLEKIWFEEIKFPFSYYNEWKQFLSWLMKWWEIEFEKRAKCLLLSHINKNKILKLIH
jgi:hypothetical protein